MQHSYIPDFTPYEEIVFCSNKIRNAKYLIKIKNLYPIIIGKYSSNDKQGKPKIWFYAMLKYGPVTLIKESNSMVEQITKKENDKELQFFLQTSFSKEKTPIITINYSIKDTPEITYLDLRPIGYNIHGDTRQLSIGGMVLQNNTMNGCNVFFEAN